MHACALMPCGDIGQAVSSFNLENAKYIHGRIVPPVDILRNKPGLCNGAKRRDAQARFQPVLKPTRE